MKKSRSEDETRDKLANAYKDVDEVMTADPANIIKAEALARLAESPDTAQRDTPDTLARLWDSVFANCTLGELSIVQSTLNNLRARYFVDPPDDFQPL